MGRCPGRSRWRTSRVVVCVLRIWLEQRGLLQVVLRKEYFWSLDEFLLPATYEDEDYDLDDM